MTVVLSTPQTRTIANMLAQHSDTYQIEINGGQGPDLDGVFVLLRQIGAHDVDGAPVAAHVNADGHIVTEVVA